MHSRWSLLQMLGSLDYPWPAPLASRLNSIKSMVSWGTPVPGYVISQPVPGAVTASLWRPTANGYLPADVRQVSG